jgi:hypothetical protein
VNLAHHWLRAVPGLKEIQLRYSLVASDIDAHDLDEVAEALEEICLLAEQVDRRAREALGAALPTLTDPAREELVSALRNLAQDRGHFALARLLRRRAGIRDGVHEVPEPSQRHPGDARVGRALTLGERKALARARNRDVLDRLLRDPHPHVIRNILENPRITEDDVVRLAARRPTYPDVQAEIAQSPKWNVRQRVRLAIVQNPYTPTGISVPLLPLLIRPELDQVLAATDIPPIVRGAAIELLGRRPPIPAREAPAIKQ